jgi:hypothetical protein
METQSFLLSQFASVRNSAQVSASAATHCLRAESQLKPRAQSLSWSQAVTSGIE